MVVIKKNQCLRLCFTQNTFIFELTHQNKNSNMFPIIRYPSSSLRSSCPCDPSIYKDSRRPPTATNQLPAFFSLLSNLFCLCTCDICSKCTAWDFRVFPGLVNVWRDCIRLDTTVACFWTFHFTHLSTFKDEHLGDMCAAYSGKKESFSFRKQIFMQF